MRLVVTGGGTGGHVYPALEVASAARELGWKVLYLGSIRGQEQRACQKVGMPFIGFPSEPLYSIASLRGIRGALNLTKAMLMARRELSSFRPDVVFSTGGYSSAPVVSATRRMGVPYVLHEQNSIPGRTNRILSKNAHCVATVFRSAEHQFPGVHVVRTGMPIRKPLRQTGQEPPFLVQSFPSSDPIVLVVGGSQGATALNDVALATAVRMAKEPLQWLHLTGVSHYEGITRTIDRMALDDRYQIRSYLEAPEMAGAMFSCALAVSRSGSGAMAELAAFRKPSILVPYPAAFANHQYYNALEFEKMGAAIILPQSDLQPSNLEARIKTWLHDPQLQENARVALAEWDVPDSIERILQLLEDASARRRVA